MKKSLVIGMTTLLLMCGVFAVAAPEKVPHWLNYTAKLYDSGGNTLSNGPVDVVFKVTDIDGNLIYSEKQTLEVVNGEVSALIGNGDRLDGTGPTGGLFMDMLTPSLLPRLEVEVTGYPKQGPYQLATVPYSAYSQWAADVLDGGVGSKSIGKGVVNFDHLSQDAKDKLIEEITGGKGKDQLVFQDTLATQYREENAAERIGVRPGLTFSGRNDLQGVLQDLDISISKRAADIDAEKQQRIASVSAEATARQQASGAEAAARQQADSAEATARQQGDSALQTNINSEAATRTAEDGKLQTNINNEASARTGADGGLDTRLTAVEKGSVSPQTDLNMNGHDVINVGAGGINVSTHRHGLNAGVATPPDPVFVKCSGCYLTDPDPSKNDKEPVKNTAKMGGAYYINFDASGDNGNGSRRIYTYRFSIHASSENSIPICAVTGVDFVTSALGGWDVDNSVKIAPSSWNSSTSSWDFEIKMAADWGTDKPVYDFMAAVVDNIGGPSNP